MAQISVLLKRLTFSDESAVSLASDDVLIIVGPNNAGKSATLRAIRDKLGNSAHVSPVLKSLEIQRVGTREEFGAWLSGWTVKQLNSPPDNPVHQAMGHAVHYHQAMGEWHQARPHLGALSRWFCHLLSADERLQICNPPQNIALAHDNPSHPIHFLLRFDDLERRLSDRFQRAFGVDLVVHRNAGSQVPLHVGVRPAPAPGEDRVSIGYIERLEQLPTLHSQGDGMRSFAGVLLATSVGRESIMLIDEPEAFLHPPQARLLGATLVQEKQAGRQLLIATHSSDVLRGVLDAGSRHVRVVRIRRMDSINMVRELSNQRIAELWSDPLLRHSDILDGLFHEGVIVCEGDADCRFYAAVAGAVAEHNESRVADVMYAHAGGKARLRVIIRALREVDVPVHAVADFDILADVEVLRPLVETLGGNWSEMEADWKLVHGSISAKKPELTTVDVRAEIEKVLAATDAAYLPARQRMEVNAVLKRSTAWAHAKQVGKAFVPAGEPTQACDRLLTSMKSLGLFVVEVGELEGFCRSVGGHGPKWVNSVIAMNLAEDAELQHARAFVQGLVDFDSTAMRDEMSGASAASA